MESMKLDDSDVTFQFETKCLSISLNLGPKNGKLIKGPSSIKNVA